MNDPENAYDAERDASRHVRDNCDPSEFFDTPNYKTSFLLTNSLSGLLSLVNKKRAACKSYYVFFVFNEIPNLKNEDY
jgi:hypothetical protein